MCPDTARKADTMCRYPGCERTVWQDPDGSFSMYCGRTHRDAMKGVVRKEDVCKNCRARPVYVQDQKKHDFCGLRCAKAYQSGRPRAPAISDTSSEDEQSPRMCKLQGCNRRAFVRGREVGEYCCQQHRRDAVSSGEVDACLNCREWPKITINGKVSDFCGRKCRDETHSAAPMLLDVPESDDVFNEVKYQFQESWSHNPHVPQIIKVWKIYATKKLRDQYEKYKLRIERKTGLDGGNTKRRWHGTIRSCTLGDNLNDNPCDDPSCSLCLIIKSSFQISRSGQRFTFGRFGEGIYTSATSSKADSYIENTYPSTTKAVLLNYVVMGKGIKMTADRPDLKEPPPDFDSVIGEPGGSLNYDESVVYDNDAIRPTFLVVYQAVWQP